MADKNVKTVPDNPDVNADTQRTLSYELNGEIIISQPWDFEDYCLVDDMRSITGGSIGLVRAGAHAVTHMFRGTKLTHEVIESLPHVDRAKLCEQAAQFYLDDNKRSDNPKNV